MAQRQFIVYRANPKETRIQNYIIWDKGMSPLARFALIAMLSLPDDWDYSVRGMAAMLNISKDTMSKYIRELEDAGYLKRRQAHSEKGRFASTQYVLTDTPGQFGEETEAEPCPKKYDTDEPRPNFSAPEISAPENSPQKKRTEEKIRTEEYSPPYNPPTGGSKRRKNAKQSEAKEAPDWKPERFALFWQAYPCGKSKQAAIKAWDKLQPDDKLLAEMARGLKRAMASDEWQRGFGIPHASTWINQRRWTDEERGPIMPPAVPVPPPMTPERFGWD